MDFGQIVVYNGTGTSFVDTSLTGGTQYFYRIYTYDKAYNYSAAVNVSGTPTSPATAPGAPTIGTASVAGVSGSASVAFTAPVSNGGATISSYIATSSPGNITGTLVQAGSGTIPVSGLTNGTAYTFTVTATNSVGTSAASGASSSVTPYTTPGAPTINSITPGDSQLSVAFTAGTTGGSAITDYKYSLNGAPFISAATTSSPFIITGLTNGTTYSVQIRAVNAAGDGAVSTSVNGTPVAPNTPSIVASPATLAAVTTTYGTASTTRTFTTSGTVLSGDLTVSAPTGFEVSTSAGSGYATSLTLTATSGTVATTTIYVRLAATAAAGSYTGNVSISGGGAATVDVATTSSTVAQKAITITGLTGVDKPYDGNTSATFTGTPAYAGLENSETFTVSGTPVAAFATAGAGNGKTITVSGYTAPSANYTLAATSLTANIATIPLAITGVSGVSRAYTGLTSATLSGTATYVGLVNSESFSVTGTPTANFATVTVGTAKPITVTGYTAPSANYTVSQPTGLSADITTKALTITGVSVSARPYNGLTTATLTGTASYSGLVNGETFTVTGTPSATFASANVGTAVSITVTGYAAPSSNYSVTQPTLSANITAVPLTITGLSGANKIYDGTTSATLSGTSAYSGLVNSEVFAVTGSPTATFANATVGTAKAITVTGYTAPNTNYTITQPSGLTANITKATPTIATPPTATSINSAQTLASSTLSGGVANGVGGALSGAFAFTTPATTPSVGTSSQGVIFNPTDTTNYNTASTTASVTVTAAGYAGTGEFNKIVATADVTDGFYILAGSTTNAMNNTITTFFSQSSISVNANKITNPATSIVWRIQANGGGKIIFNEAISGYVSYTGGGNAAQVSSSVTGNTERWTIAASSNLFTFINVADSTRYLQYNSGSTRFACYTNSLTNITLYKLTPVITGAATATAFTTTYGTSSDVQTFNVSATGLGVNLVANAPTGYEVSAEGISYGTTASFVPVSGIASGLLRIRLAATAAVTGSYNSQNITLSSTGATTVNIATAASGNTVTAKALTITGLSGVNKVYDGTTTATLSGTSVYSGLVNGQTFTVSGTPAATFADANVGTAKAITVTGYTAPSANYSVTQPTGLTSNITQAAVDPLAVTFTPDGNGAYTASSPGVSGFTYNYTGRSGTTYSSSTAPTAPGYYTVTATSSDSNYAGGSSQDYFIAGPIAVSDSVTKSSNTAPFKIPVATLLANDKRIDDSGTLLTTGLSVSGVTSGTATVTVSGAFVFFTPSASATDTFTYTLSDGTKTATGTVTVSTAAAAPFTLSILRVVTPAAFDSTNTSVTVEFAGVPGQTYQIQYSTDMSTWSDPPLSVSTGSTGTFNATFTTPGDHAAAWGSLFFRATR
ncbi:MAG: YDG domain-containing protein [Luteolibacter sp.]